MSRGLYDPSRQHDACGVAFVADVAGRASRRILDQSLTVLSNLAHRGAQGCEETTGDGAGILVQMPHRFLVKAAGAVGIELPEAGRYGAGLAFLAMDPDGAAAGESVLDTVAGEEGCRVLGWRDVPVELGAVGPTARRAAPRVRQIFIGGFSESASEMDRERKLYVIRKRAEHAAARSGAALYLPSLSSRTLVYKGMLTPEQLTRVYPDLLDPDFDSALALVHSRFSTNTFPSWPLAHPYRFIAHNGEINTCRGNVNWMRARESLLSSDLFPELERILPIVTEGASDSAIFDNVLELLHLGGRELPEALLMMIPEPWAGDDVMDPELRAFYEYHGCLMEPWDGPASIAFTDGALIGAVLDRNGLRPSRYLVTRDGLVVMASEAGVLDVPEESVLVKQRLQPGRMLLVDTREGRLIPDEEVKKRYASRKPYRRWLARHLLRCEELPEPSRPRDPAPASRGRRQIAFGYTQETVRFFLAPMAESGSDPVSSMGDDRALAVLSQRPRLLYDYFKQLFAQVTNPPLDAIREELVTQLSSTLGAEGNLLAPSPESCRQLALSAPVLGRRDFAKIAALDRPGLQAFELSLLLPAAAGVEGFREAIDDLFRRAEDAVVRGHSLLVLTDRGLSREQAALPALLATAGLHHHLIRRGLRTRASLVLDAGEAWQVHHVCLLLGYGAGAVHPSLALETIAALAAEGRIEGASPEKAEENYLHALNHGVLKVLSKMGISAVPSYRGAQIFEAVGLGEELVARFFTGTPSGIGGIDLATVAEETLSRHRRAFSERMAAEPDLDAGGHVQWRRDGEIRLFDPETVFQLQHSTRTGRYDRFKQYTRRVDEQARARVTLRSLLEPKWAKSPVPLEEVEPAEAILRRFATGAMSYGSISQEAHETLAIAMNRIGGKSNTGEGGEDPARYVPDPNGDSRRSAVKQVASGRFGVTSEYLVNADDLQIKMAQGAKPGEGGQLPGQKVYPWIARVRHSTPGVGLISPPPHHDIYSIEDLAQLIYDLKNSNPRARIHVKLVSEHGVGTVAAGVAKAKADVVLISGHDGGTGASPITSIQHAGSPWELGLAETQQTLVANGLRDRIVVQVDGQMKTGRDVVIAALLGAEEFGFATAPLVAMGCVLMRVCHLNTCPVGIATQDPELRRHFSGSPELVESFFRFVAEEVREYLAKLGFRRLDEIVGRVDRLSARPVNEPAKAGSLDLTALLHRPEPYRDTALRRTRSQRHRIEETLDATVLVPRCRAAVERGAPVELRLPIRNVNRTVGTLLGYEVTRRHGAQGLPEDTIRLRFRGSAGQSFGAFLPRGISLFLEGDANDYTGKGLSGGKIAVYPSRDASFAAEENVILGNVALYGATGGALFARGIAGERFAVRNSGALAVVEGVGDHGCEYMTGGRVVVLGTTGRNFAAGMSGGIAYVLDEQGGFHGRCNRELVDLEPLSEEDEEDVRRLVAEHVRLTASAVGDRVLALWDGYRRSFVKVMPRDYRRALSALRRAERENLPWEQVVMEGAHG